MKAEKIDVEELVEWIGGRNFYAFWRASKEYYGDFVNREKIFFKFIELLLDRNEIMLTKNQKIAEDEDGTNKIIEELKKAFPKTEEEMQDGLWFYFDECPWGVVWLPGDGTIFWTT